MQITIKSFAMMMPFTIGIYVTASVGSVMLSFVTGDSSGFSKESLAMIVDKEVVPYIAGFLRLILMWAVALTIWVSLLVLQKIRRNR